MEERRCPRWTFRRLTDLRINLVLIVKFETEPRRRRIHNDFLATKRVNPEASFAVVPRRRGWSSRPKPSAARRGHS